MKKFFYLLIVSCFLILTPKESIAQPQPFAAGEIVINPAPIGTEPCGSLHRYEVILKFYRDAGGGAATPPAAPVITFANPKIMANTANEGFLQIALTQFDSRGAIDNECIKGDPIVTEGTWYRGQISLPEAETPWNAYFGNVRVIVIRGKRVPQVRGDLVHSPENLNIEQGQAYTLRTDIVVQCEDIVTTATDVPPNYSITNRTHRNRTAELLTEDLVQTYCHGQDYEFQIPIVDYDNPPLDLDFDGVIEPGESLGPDSLHFELTSALKGSRAVLYVDPYSSQAPIPLETGTKMEITNDGFVTFKPRLLPGDNSFFGVVTIRVSEYRKRVVAVPKNFGAGALYDSLAIEYDPEPIAVTYRQFRYIIDRRCNKNLPDITRDSLHWNYAEEAWEFPCASQKFTFDMSFPMYEHSLKRGGTDNDDNLDIRIIRGTESSPESDDQEPVFDIIPIDQTPLELALGEFSKFTIVTKKTLGPGKYSFFFKLGSDNNTLINRCGFQVPEYDSIPVYINGDFEYEYYDRGDSINICYPQSDVQFFPLVAQPNVGYGDEFEFKFHYAQNRPLPPAVEWDTSFIAFYAGRTSKKNTYTDTIRLDSNENPILKEGRWRIELGRVYRHEFNNVIYKNTCFDDDDVYVNIFENEEVVARKWDLCPEEEWPVINLDSMSTKYNAEDYLWGFETKKEENVTIKCLGVVTPDTIIYPCLKAFYKSDLKILDTTQEVVDGKTQYTITVNGTRHARDEEGNILLDTIAVGGSGNSQFPLSSVAFGSRGRFMIESVVQLQNGECFDTSFFEIRKGEVEVSIGRDSTICPGQQYVLTNDVSYYTPDSIAYEWSLDGSIIPGADSNSILITEQGVYRLTVYKRSELDKNGQQVICFGEDSVRIRIADVLAPPVPKCASVTFKNDSVRQTFFWPEVEGADGYEVRVISPKVSGSPDTTGWIDPNGEYNLIHKTAGREVQIMVRPYNWEVPENSICRYGPISNPAAPCEVVVKPVNIFTPNGDGINDVLRFDLLEIYIGNKLQIFNRWGELMYEDNDYLNDWDGGDLKDGTYYYVLIVGDDANSLLKGNVTIVR